MPTPFEIGSLLADVNELIKMQVNNYLFTTTYICVLLTLLM